MSDDAYHFSITIECDDIAIVYCLRGLSMFSQGEGNVYTPWKGTGKTEWACNHNRVTFRFTSARYRGDFLKEAKRLLPPNLWREIKREDNDPPLDF